MGNDLSFDHLGLSRGTVVKETGENNLTIIKNRKSRIIMKDGAKIVSEANKIREKYKKIRVSFSTTAEICGKTQKLLKENDIEIIESK